MLFPQATEQDSRQYRTAMLAQARQEQMAREVNGSPALTTSTGNLLVRVGGTLSMWGQTLRHRSSGKHAYHFR